ITFRQILHRDTLIALVVVAGFGLCLALAFRAGPITHTHAILPLQRQSTLAGIAQQHTRRTAGPTQTSPQANAQMVPQAHTPPTRADAMAKALQAHKLTKAEIALTRALHQKHLTNAEGGLITAKLAEIKQFETDLAHKALNDQRTAIRDEQRALHIWA